MLSRIFAAVFFSLMAVALPSFAYAQQAATAARQDTGNTALAAINTVMGLKTDAKSTATDGTSITWMQVLKQISASVQAPPSQAVTNAGTFLVQNNAATPAGTALIGKVGIDQTTPGTTNKVSIGSDGTVGLVAGSALVGKVGIDQTTPGTTNKVSIGTDGTVGITETVPLPTGAATEATLAGTVHLNGSSIPQVEVTDSTGSSLDLSRPDTVTRTSTAVSASAFTAIAANAARRMIYMDNTSTGIVWCRHGTSDPTAGLTGTSSFHIDPGRTFASTLDEWAGAYRCIGDAANGNIVIDELSNS